MTDIRLFGYSDPLSAKAGEPIDFMISAEGTNTANAEISRLIHGDYNKEGPGFVEESIESDVPITIKVKRQYTQGGSFIKVKDKKQSIMFKKIPLVCMPLFGLQCLDMNDKQSWVGGLFRAQKDMLWVLIQMEN